MNESTRKAIDKAIVRTLEDAGVKTPPVRIEDLLAHLRLHRDFYDLEDPTLLQRFLHKVKVQGHALVHVLRKIKLAAVWLPDETRILVDASLPTPKQEWASFHDSVHRILEWHRQFFLGDTAQTLDPEFQEQLEAEANYGASALMFCGPVFTREARDTAREWASIELLHRRYGKSYVTTLRRYAEHGPDHPMAVLISTPLWKDKAPGQPERWRHFVRSQAFSAQFSGIAAEDLLGEVDGNAAERRGGAVADFTCSLDDDNGEPHEFRGQSFFNAHDILTLFVELRRLDVEGIVVPKIIKFPASALEGLP